MWPVHSDNLKQEARLVRVFFCHNKSYIISPSDV
ncbi:hypothetical protein VPHK250G1_0021 [Vibrio phage K250 g1]